MSAQPDHSPVLGALAGSSDPRPEQVMDESFAAVPDAVAHARRRLVERLRDLGADDRSLADVAIAVSEACTNAVVHAYPESGRGTFEVAAVVEDDRVHVEVADYGVGVQARIDTPGLGLGLPLIASLSDSLAVTSRVADINGDGTSRCGTVLSMTFTLAREGQRGT